MLRAELQALEFEEERVEYEEVEQRTPDGIAMMAQWRALKAACDALSPVGRYKVASVSYRKCAPALRLNPTDKMVCQTVGCA